MRVRALVVILLSVVCGVAAAFGVFQVLEAQINKQRDAKPDGMYDVVVAAKQIDRGAVIEETQLKVVQFPKTLPLDKVLVKTSDAIAKMATTPIPPNTPLFEGSVTDDMYSGPINEMISPGMRGFSIQTSGPSASVAGFVRPRDYVDVLLTISGSPNDQFGGGTTMTILEHVMILAIDQSTDVEQNQLMLMAKGGKLSSVTLLVTEGEVELLALAGQVKSGTLSLALRNIKDPQNDDPRTDNLAPTMKAITDAIAARQVMDHLNLDESGSPQRLEPTEAEQNSPGDNEASQRKAPAGNEFVGIPKKRLSVIRTSRKGQQGEVQLDPVGN